MAAGAQDRAILDAQGADVGEIDEPAPARQRCAIAVEYQTAERDAVAAFGREQRGSLRQDERGRAAHADELRAGGSLEPAGAIDAGRQKQRRAGARGAVDGALQACALVVGRARAHAELRGIDPLEPLRGKRRSDGRRGERGRARHAAGDEAAAVDLHPAIMALRG